MTSSVMLADVLRLRSCRQISSHARRNSSGDFRLGETMTSTSVPAEKWNTHQANFARRLDLGRCFQKIPWDASLVTPNYSLGA